MDVRSEWRLISCEVGNKVWEKHWDCKCFVNVLPFRVKRTKPQSLLFMKREGLSNLLSNNTLF